MSDSKKILEYLQKENDNFVELLKTVVEMESPTYGDKELTDKCGRFFQELYKELGFKITVLPQTTCGDHFIAELGEGEKTILIGGHYDTAYGLGVGPTMPWKIEDGKAYGPAAMDMKGGLVMAYYAVKALQELGLPMKSKIRMVISSDEEMGSVTTKELYLEEGRKADYALVLEPGKERVGDIKSERAGRAIVNILVHGKAAHSGNNPWEAISAIDEMGYLLGELKKMNEYENKITVAPLFITGGLENSATVPGEGRFTVDVRTPTMEAMNATIEKIKNLQPKTPGCTLEVIADVKPPLEFNPTFFAMAEAFAAELGYELNRNYVGGGSDGNYIASTGTPTLDGMGMSGKYLHNPQEHIMIEHIPYRTALLARLLQTL